MALKSGHGQGVGPIEAAMSRAEPMHRLKKLPARWRRADADGSMPMCRDNGGLPIAEECSPTGCRWSSTSNCFGPATKLHRGRYP